MENFKVALKNTNDRVYVPVKSWCKDIEASALDQIENLSRLPFAFHHIAIMPDCHAGYGMPIGSVLATKGIVIPFAVGMDIGCGMCALKTSIHESELNPDTIECIVNEIRKVIPVGFHHNEKPCSEDEMPRDAGTIDNALIICKEFDKARYQMGTLGGGNHFIEIQKGPDGNIWVMLHSGSRNLGKKICDNYNDIAKKMNAMYFSSVDPKWNLAFLPMDSKEGVAYLHEMKYALDFARYNRFAMMKLITAILQDKFDRPGARIVGQYEFDAPPDNGIINIHHNYARMENHYNENVLVHRKGATRAYKDEIGIIPGCMGTKSYIVKGLGNQESFMSCSHGAGRAMGRNVARKTLDLADEQRKLDSQGIVHSIKSIHDLDEAAGAYKDIHSVMDQQKDLVEILVELTPVGSVKDNEEE